MKHITKILVFVIVLMGGNQSFARETDTGLKKHTIYIHMGYGCITNAVTDGADLGSDDLRKGMTEQIGYNYNINGKIALGALIDGYHSVNIDDITGGVIETDIDMAYIAPQFALNIPFSPLSAWFCELRAGVGMLYIHQDLYSNNGIVKVIEGTANYGWAMNASVGVEWHLSQMIGFSATISDTFGKVKDKYKDEYILFKPWRNVNRLSIMVGLKFHF